MCKEMLVIPVNKAVDQKNNWKKWRAEEEETHKWSLTQKKKQTKQLRHRLAFIFSLDVNVR
jgi:hypothetical protein